MKIERIVFFGTAPIAVPALEALVHLSDCEVVAVCTQPDRPQGRKRRLAPSPVKQTALSLGLTVFDPEKVADAGQPLEMLRPDLGVVFAYGQYMPASVFDLPPSGSVNFHPSLLPRYRGASPIQSALANGDQQTGLSVIRVGKQMDAGDILMQEPVILNGHETSEDLTNLFARMAGDWIPEVIARFRDDRLSWRQQEDSEAVECSRLTKQDGAVDWSEPAQTLYNRWRAYQPWPGLFFKGAHGEQIKVVQPELEQAKGAPGEILDVQGGGPLIACGEGGLRLNTLQPAGKQPMPGEAFLRGHDWQKGDQLPVRQDG